MTTEYSARLALEMWPTIISQASVPANNNVLTLDMTHNVSVKSATTAAQPGAPTTGDMYLLPPSPTGAAWASIAAGRLVLWDGTTWQSKAPYRGLGVEAADTGRFWFYTTAWKLRDALRGTRGADIASAATVNLATATGDYVHVTGTTGPITSLGAPAAASTGLRRRIVFDSTPTLTHNAAIQCLGNANIVCQAGDIADMVWEATYWNMAAFSRKDGSALVAAALADGSVTFPKIQDISTSKLLGRTTAGTGDVEEVALDNDATLAANSAIKVATQAAVKGYVDQVVNGRSWKTAVRAATTAAVTLATDLENGDTLDGVVLATGDRILVKNQASATENGLYTVNASGAPTRSTDADAGAELVNASCYVAEGTANADTQWTCTANAPITLGATNLTFVQSGAGATYTADGVTLDLAGTVFSIKPGGVGSTQLANSGVTLPKIANQADQTILGNNTGGAAAPVALTVAQVNTMLGTAPFGDGTPIVKGSADATKLLRFEVDGFTAGATRVATPPNSDFTMAGINIAQTWTAEQYFSYGLKPSANYLIIDDGGWVSFQYVGTKYGWWFGGAMWGFSKFTVNRTADATLASSSYGQSIGSVQSNIGATVKPVLELPPAVAGMFIDFVVMDADGLRVQAAAGDNIRVLDNITATAGYIESLTIGSYARLLAMDGTTWTAFPIGGKWTDSVFTYDDTNQAGAAPTIASGFGTSPSISASNGTQAFALTVGTATAGINTGTLTMPAAATGWVVHCQNVTNPDSFIVSQTGGTTTTVTLKNYSRTTGLAADFTASDVIRIMAMAY